MTSSATHYRSSNGWEIDYEVVPGSGLVLTNVAQANYFFARDLRVVAVYAATGDPNSTDPSAQGKSVKLRLADNLSQAPDGGARINDFPAPPEDFPYHPSEFGATASFTSAPMPLFPNGADALTITQDYQFTRYAIDPPHEPGGALYAARLLPLVTFRCDQVGAEGDPDIQYIRIDYRLGITLQSWDPNPPSPAQNWGMSKSITPDQVGVFRDSETVPLMATPSGQAGALPKPPTLREIYTAAEKPLLFEMVGRGLEHGSAYSPSSDPWSWDNTHQWPAAQNLPNTPGSNYACHNHWRWGAASGNPDTWAARSGLLPAAGPQFRGYGWTTAQGGPLIDHRIPDQSLWFAIAHDYGNPAANVSTQPFPTQFTGLPSQPTQPVSIKDGDQIVQWLSVEIFRGSDDQGKPWTGTVYVNGLVFAHDPQPSWSTQQPYIAYLTGLGKLCISLIKLENNGTSTLRKPMFPSHIVRL